MDNNIKEKIRFQVEGIDNLFLEYQPIFKKIETMTPDLFDVTILGSVLHSFYNGLENIFEIIAKNIDNNVPSGNKSHQELLQQMASDNEKRQKLFDEKLYLKLREYATFRHFYRHAYSFQIDYEKLEPLVEDIKNIWDELRKNLEKLNLV